jgi:hypothetical protein
LNRHVEVFDALWEWVTRPRTDDEKQVVIGMKCSCSLDERRDPNI